MSLKQLLEYLALLAQIVSFPVAAWALYLTRKEANAARKEAQAARDLQIALNLSESFRSRWEGGWSDTLYEVTQFQEMSGTSDIPEKYQDPLIRMLNWIDWLGVLIRTKSLTQKEIIFDSIGPQFKSAITISKPLLKPYFDKYGPDYWAGLNAVAAALNVEMDFESLQPSREGAAEFRAGENSLSNRNC